MGTHTHIVRLQRRHDDENAAWDTIREMVYSDAREDRNNITSAFHAKLREDQQDRVRFSGVDHVLASDDIVGNAGIFNEIPLPCATFPDGSVRHYRTIVLTVDGKDPWC